jgi:hypothetical protein
MVEQVVGKLPVTVVLGGGVVVDSSLDGPAVRAVIRLGPPSVEHAEVEPAVRAAVAVNADVGVWVRSQTGL